LTSGYSYLYALALVPVGLLADRVARPKLLAVGLALWSTLSIVSSSAGSFAELLVARTGFAVAQAAQNPVSFSLIPDLFPNNKSTALAAYNCAIYLGRALSFASVLAAHRVRSGAGPVPIPAGTMADAAAGTAGSEGVQLSMVPLDNLDLQRMSIIYTTGDMAAVTPLYNYNFHVIAYESAAGSDGGWRELLRWIGYPGFAIALLMALTVAEPRDAGKGGFSVTNPATWKAGTARLSTQLFNTFTGHGWHHSSDKDSSSSSSGVTGAAAVDQQQLSGPACVVDVQQPTPALAVAAAGGGAAAAALALPGTAAGADAAAAAAADEGSSSSSTPAAGFMQPIQSLLSIKSFQATTIAAALNDLGSYALIAWHSTFYERVFGLDSGVYAPMLAVILPVGGILGGVGGGLIADYLSVVGGRYWLTAGRCAVL
jgi:MFS family permease